MPICDEQVLLEIQRQYPEGLSGNEFQTAYISWKKNKLKEDHNFGIWMQKRFSPFVSIEPMGVDYHISFKVPN
jgi:hypothetical protein